MVEKFFQPGDNPRYQAWLAAHPDGYVVNIGRSGRSGRAFLHRATCKWIKELHGRGNTFVDQWVKWCSTSEEELQEEVKEARDVPAEHCYATPSRGALTEPVVAPLGSRSMCDLPFTRRSAPLYIIIAS
jgi:hypothetical protein